MKTNKYPKLKLAALQASEKSGLPFLTKEGNFTPEFKTFWQIFEEAICEWDSERRRRWTQTILSLLSLTASIIALCRQI